LVMLAVHGAGHFSLDNRVKRNREQNNEQLNATA